MTKFLLVRHGQTDWNQLGRYQGHVDTPLNDTGRSQARILASQVPKDSIAAIYSSDLIRALETAKIIASKLNARVFIDHRLREIRLGEWEGMYIDDIVNKYPQDWSWRQIDPVNARSPRGESLGELADRLNEFMDEVVELNPGDQVMLVSHGLASATLLCLANGIPLGEAYQNIPDNGKIIEIYWPPLSLSSNSAKSN